MIPYLIAIARSYAPWIMLPAAIVVGTIGYNVESMLSNKWTPGENSSIQEKRDSRILEQLESDPTKVEKLTIGANVNNVFGKNTSPSLLKDS